MSNYGPPGGPQHDHPQEPWSGGPASDPYETPSDPWADVEQARDQQPGQGQWQPGQDQWSSAGDRWDGQPDQWAGSDRWGGQPASTPPDGGAPTVGSTGTEATQPQSHHAPGPSYPAPGYPPPTPDPAWSQLGPSNAPPRGGRTGFVVVLAILAVLLLGSGGLAAYLVNMRDGTTDTVSQSDVAPTGATIDPASGGDDPDDRSGEPYVDPDRTAPETRSSTDARFVTVGQCVVNQGSVDEPALVIAECADETYQVLERFDGPTTGQEDAKQKCSTVEGYTDWYFFDSPFDALDYVLCLKLT